MPGLNQKKSDHTFAMESITIYFCCPLSARGETGRHAILRGWCLNWCGSSNLLVRTKSFRDLKDFFFAGQLGLMRLTIAFLFLLLSIV